MQTTVGRSRFASQVKALLAGGKVSSRPDPAGLVGFHLFGAVPEPFTSFTAIRAMPAGSTMVVDALGAHPPRKFHSISAVLRAGEKEAPKSEGEVTDALLDSVKHHMVADVPVGAFLSSGIDSGALVGLMWDAGQRDIQTVTIAFEEFKGTSFDESELAGKVAANYGARHTRRVVTRDEFDADLPKILLAMDQPSIDGFNTWFAAKAAAEIGLKVVVSGLGGDELFGGYASFTQVPRLVRALAAPSRIPMLGAIARRLVGGLLAGRLGLHPKSAGLLEYGGSYAGAYLLRRAIYMPWELASVLDPDFAAEGLRRLRPVGYVESALEGEPRTAFGKVAAMEAQIYMRNQLLRDSDWASMAHGVELRVPLVDSVLLQRVAGFAIRHKCQDKKSSLANAPSRKLPYKVAMRRKTGFTSPTAQWAARLGVKIEGTLEAAADIRRDAQSGANRRGNELPTVTDR